MFEFWKHLFVQSALVPQKYLLAVSRHKGLTWVFATPFGPELLAEVQSSARCFKQHWDALSPAWSHRPPDIWWGNSCSSWCLHLCSPLAWGAMSPCPPCLTNVSLEHAFPFLTLLFLSWALYMLSDLPQAAACDFFLAMSVFGCCPCSSSSEWAALRPYLGHWTPRFVCHDCSGASNILNMRQNYHSSVGMCWNQHWGCLWNCLGTGLSMCGVKTPQNNLRVLRGLRGGPELPSPPFEVRQEPAGSREERPCSRGPAPSRRGLPFRGTLIAADPWRPGGLWWAPRCLRSLFRGHLPVLRGRRPGCLLSPAK